MSNVARFLAGHGPGRENPKPAWRPGGTTHFPSLVVTYRRVLAEYVRALESAPSARVRALDADLGAAGDEDEGGEALLEAGVARGILPEEIVDSTTHAFFNGPGAMGRALLGNAPVPPTRRDALSLLALEGAQPGALRRVRDLSAESAARFAQPQRGLLWLTQEGSSVSEWSESLLTAVKAGAAFVPVNSLCSSTWGVDMDDKPDQSDDLARTRDPTVRRMVRERPWLRLLLEEFSALVGMWNIWQVLAEEGERMARCVDVTGRARLFEYGLPGGATPTPTPWPGETCVLLPMDPARNPFAPMLDLARSGVLLLGWIEGRAALYMPQVRVPS